MKKILLILFILANTNLALSQAFNVSGVIYQIIPSTTTVQINPFQSILAGNLEIPSIVNYNSTDYTVTTLLDEAFYNCGLNSITLPNTLTTIGNRAFKYCSVLTSVTIPNSVTSLGTEVFYGCTSLTSITIPNSITTIPDLTFISCENLTSVTLPNTLTSIGVSAFQSCGLTSITLPNTLTSIASGAFSNCYMLPSIIIPNSVTSIGERCFESCDVLSSVTLPNTLTSIAYKTFKECPSLTSITLPSTLTFIDMSAFESCTNLTSIICGVTTPLVLHPDVFLYVNQSACSLCVPEGSVTAYQNAPIWQIFNPISSCSILNTSNFNINQNIEFYPNPTSSYLFINLKNLTNIQLDVMDITGKILFNQTLNYNNTIDTSTLSNGMYLFKIISDQGSIIEKIIKN